MGGGHVYCIFPSLVLSPGLLAPLLPCSPDNARFPSLMLILARALALPCAIYSLWSRMSQKKKVGASIHDATKYGGPQGLP